MTDTIFSMKDGCFSHLIIFSRAIMVKRNIFRTIPTSVAINNFIMVILRDFICYKARSKVFLLNRKSM